MVEGFIKKFWVSYIIEYVKNFFKERLRFCLWKGFEFVVNVVFVCIVLSVLILLFFRILLFFEF